MTCHCGCNQPAKRNFLPGHDQKLRSQLERKVGGLLNLADLLTHIEAFLNNELTSAQFAHAARTLFDQAKSRARIAKREAAPMLHLELEPEIEAQLTAEAKARGLQVDRYVEGILTARPTSPVTRCNQEDVLTAIEGLKAMRITRAANQDKSPLVQAV